jgi:hypothetical protein
MKMNSLLTNSMRPPLSRAMQLREAVVRTLCDPLPTEFARLIHLSREEWEGLLRWLDTSGMALYFLDRLEELGLEGMLPTTVLARLKQNLADNTERIHRMIAESVGIQQRFQEAGLTYAVVKGFSLWPLSVPKPELRSQLDQDFLVSEESASEAQRILEDFGYKLFLKTGRHLDFKADKERTSSLKDLYKAGMTRTAELHIDPLHAERASRLSRTERVPFHGLSMPVMSPADLLLGQGMHVYRHLCNQFTRTAHLLEFRRHVIARYGDEVVWEKLRQHVARDAVARTGLGTLTLVIAKVMGPFAPEAFTRWCADEMPVNTRLWVDLYARRAVLASFPGSKLHLLLPREPEATDVAQVRRLWPAAVPRCLPRVLAGRAPNEKMSMRVERYRRQFFYVMERLRFHFVEGIRHYRDAIVWRRCRHGLQP